MKASIWKALSRPLAVCAVSGTLGSGVLGQETQTAPAAPLAPTSHVTCADTSPEARYPFFFEDIVGWDEAAKTSLAQGGDAEMAEAWRTRLQKYSGLTAEEAEQVKRVARQWVAFEKAFNQESASVGQQYFASHPHYVPNIHAPEPPEFAALRQERLDMVHHAISELVTALGSRSFTRLDLYTIHMHDWAISANRAPAHDIPPCQGPQQ